MPSTPIEMPRLLPGGWQRFARWVARQYINAAARSFTAQRYPGAGDYPEGYGLMRAASTALEASQRSTSRAVFDQLVQAYREACAAADVVSRQGAMAGEVGRIRTEAIRYVRQLNTQILQRLQGATA